MNIYRLHFSQPSRDKRPGAPPRTFGAEVLATSKADAFAHIQKRFQYTTTGIMLPTNLTEDDMEESPDPLTNDKIKLAMYCDAVTADAMQILADFQDEKGETQ